MNQVKSATLGLVRILKEIPKVFIVLKEGTEASEEEIVQFVGERVASYKAIREVEFRKEIPPEPRR